MSYTFKNIIEISLDLIENSLVLLYYISKLLNNHLLWTSLYGLFHRQRLLFKLLSFYNFSILHSLRNVKEFCFFLYDIPNYNIIFIEEYLQSSISLVHGDRLTFVKPIHYSSCIDYSKYNYNQR